MKIVVSAAALADLQRLREFLSEANPSAARRVAATLDEAISSFHIFPQRGRRVGGTELRELVVPFGRSAYVVRYAHRPERDEIIVVRVWHGRELAP